MVRCLDRMAREQLIDEWSSRAMIAILSDQQHNGLLPEPLPFGTAVAHKTARCTTRSTTSGSSFSAVSRT